MPPSAPKRRHGGDEAQRPKKKFKKFKARAYHSSSEDDSEDESNGASKSQFVARDVPRKNRESANQPETRSAQKTVPPGEDNAAPRSILKASAAINGRPAKSKSSKENASTLSYNTMHNAVVGLQEEDSSDDEAATDAAEELDALEEDEEEGDNDLKGDEGDEFDLDDEEVQDEDEDEDEDDGDDDDDEDPDPSGTSSRHTKKRNDPSAFALSITKILDTKLSTSKRHDPVLSRSQTAADATRTLADEKLEQKARAQIRAEKKLALEKGRVKDVLGLETPEVDTGKVLEQEKRLKKTAQRGVVKLFNAVRAAQVKVEEARAQARSEGVVGMQKREERVNEMSKQGFLDLISSGG